MAMTPRQIAAFLHFLDRDDAIAEARQVAAMRVAFGADQKQLDDYIKGLGLT